MKTLLCVLLLAVCTLDATVISSTGCGADSTSSSGLYSCNVRSPQGGTASADTEASDSFNGAVLMASERATAVAVSSPPPQGSVEGGPSEARASIDLALVLGTAGQPRSGFAHINWVIGSQDGFSGALTVGPLAFKPNNSVFFECCSSILIPFEVGLPFNFDMSANNFQSSGGITNEGDGTTTGTLTLEFFEADGVAPVAVSEVATPEPMGLALFGMAGIGLRAWRTKKSAQTFQ